MSDPQVSAIEVTEVDPTLRLIPSSLPIDPDQHGPTHVRRLVRPAVEERLQRAADSLPDGAHLMLVEGYRPATLQARYFDSYLTELRTADPGLSPEEARRLASRYISPPEVAPHTAGAAIDVQLVDAGGAVIDTGTRINASPEESDGRCYTAHPEVTGAARRWRDALSAAMTGAGFVNYPSEWWHWSYGDRYWALMTGAERAHFGPVPG